MRSLPIRCLLFLVYLSGTPCRAEESDEQQFFESRIRPVLVAHCYPCHSVKAEEVGGDLLLDSREGLRTGGESGIAIQPGKPAESLLLAAIRYEGLEMPPTEKLPDQVIADFERWILRGAIDPREQGAAARTAAATSVDVDAGRDFWAFQRPRAHAAPSVLHVDWPRRKIDRFILARLEARGLSPSRRAARSALVRRLSFDLTGLPPSPDVVAGFVQTTDPAAYDRLVEQLLGSPQFGERWARLWLDVARYAEDQAHIVGNDDSLFYPNAYLYRDWLIGAMNQDMPFDQFAKLQLAADVMGPQGAAHHVALGFLGLGPKYYRRNAPEVMADEWEDRVDTVTRGFMGLTVACARCHDHKYDPIPTKDYYALAGVFASTEMFNRPRDVQVDQSQPAKKASDAIHIVREGDARDLPVHIRGDAFNQGDTVPRHFLTVLSRDVLPLQEGSGRRQLAEAIACEENPLTARVIVNRIWGQYFGQPLVSTPSNFGQLGSRPTHPELLDDLTVRFIQSGWSLKWLHREIVSSAAYQQSSAGSPDVLREDPANQWIGRMRRRRLSVEMWRDAMLAATGELEPQVGGASLEVSDPQARRRSVYGHVSRMELNKMQQMFDFPDPNVHAASRSETTTPLQKLFILNSDFMLGRARRFVERLQAELPAGDREQRVRRAYALVYARQPTEAECALARDFLKSDAHWEQFAQVLFASNEMLHLD